MEYLRLPTKPGATKRHAELFTRFLRQVGTGANVVQDANLAALAVEHGLTLRSTDSDFARFHGLNWHNPSGSAINRLLSKRPVRYADRVSTPRPTLGYG